MPHRVDAVAEEEPGRRRLRRPGQGGGLPDALVQFDVDRADLADRVLVLHRTSQGLHLGAMAVAEVHHQVFARGGDRVAHGEAVLQRRRQRLLAQHVQPALQRHDDGLAMRFVRRRHHHRVESLAVQHLGVPPGSSAPPTTRGPGPPPASRRGPRSRPAPTPRPPPSTAHTTAPSSPPRSAPLAPSLISLAQQSAPRAELSTGAGWAQAGKASAVPRAVW